jgi:hypothetical protein
MTIGSGYHGEESGTPLGSVPRLGDGRFDFLATPREALRLVEGSRESWLNLEQVDIGSPKTAPTPAQLARLRLLRDAVQALVGRKELRFRRLLGELLGHYRYQLDRQGNLRPVASGWDAFTARLLPALIDAHENIERVRLCANPACRWAIFDLTKNGTRIWCHPSLCGNRMKVRAFRERARRRRHRLATGRSQRRVRSRDAAK